MNQPQHAVRLIDMDVFPWSNEDGPQPRKKWRTVLLVIALCIIAGVGGYFVGELLPPPGACGI